MDNLLDLKQRMMPQKLFIFPTNSLCYEYMTEDHLRDVLNVVCTEVSALDVNSLFMPHDIADVALGALDKDQFNDTEWHEVKENMYTLVIDFTDIIFQGIQVYADLDVVDIDVNMIKIRYQEKPGEIY